MLHKKRKTDGFQLMKNWKKKVNWLRESSRPTPSSKIVNFVQGVVE
jgi:hypothetical protein